MEHPQGPRKPLSVRRARSLDRSPNPRKDSESCGCQGSSLPTASSRQALPRSASDGSRHPKSPRDSAAPGTTGTALSQEGTKEFLPREQRPPKDAKKDKAQSRAQQGLLKTVMNFFLRTGPEETREKANRRAKGKEGLPQPAEAPELPGEPAPRKKAHDKKTSRKKHSHKKHADEQTRGVQGQEVQGQEAALPQTAAVSRSEEADQGPGLRGGEDTGVYQSLLIQGQDAGVSASSSQATGRCQEEDLKKLDKDTIIRMIVQMLREVGDRWEEEQLLASQPEVAPQNPAPPLRKKSQEKKSNLKKSFSHKKHSSEEPKRAGAADVSSPESRPSKRPSFLYMCVGGHRPSISSSLGLEEPEVQDALSTDYGSPSPFELSTQAGGRGPGEDLQLDRASECKKFIQEIIALLQDEEEPEGEKQLHVQEPEVAVEHLTPPCRKKSQERKSSFIKAFSHKKHGSKEPKKGGAAGAASPESRLLKRPTYLALCVGGNRPSSASSLELEGLEFQEPSPAEGGRVGSSEASSQAGSHKPEGRPLPDGACESKKLIIQKLVALLQEVDGHLGEQIRRYPSFKRFFYQLPDASLVKLTATLRRQGACCPESDRNPAERPYQFAFGLANGRHNALSLMGLRYPQFRNREAPQNITSPEVQSPD
ncbi:protein BNIP5 isoform X2 [Phyllostomus hastatus]|uniref:protein BNIP5 isoform X2 n=1 Tax=Phyllostomus hastatus TaxID=9423 RepID=UPI001E67E578|nr:protein BNIP5 isoform X2 [Phyllostomus hastatus]